MDRKRLEEVARKRAPKRPKILDMPDAQGITGGDALSRILQDVQPEISKEPVQKIILYLKEGLNPADKNFTKYPNEIHGLIADRLTEYESVAYMKLWRESWGHGRNYCRISYASFLKETSLKSLSTVRRAIGGLKSKQFVITVLDKQSDPDVDKIGKLYRICTPSELISGQVEEGISFDDIPQGGVFCVNMVTQNTTKNLSKGRDSGTVFSRNMVTENSVLTEHGQKEHSTMFSEDMSTQNTLPRNAVNTTSGEPVLTEHGQKEHPLKEDSLKDSLSPDHIIDLFYTGIGQKRISKGKREKALKVIQELLTDGFSLEDIHFAAKWTIENAKEKPYNFALLKDTISQAFTAKTTADKARKAKSQSDAAKETEAQQAAEYEKIKAGMTDEERTELRKRAETDIRESGEFQEQFVTDMLIVAKENEILAR